MEAQFDADTDQAKQLAAGAKQLMHDLIPKGAQSSRQHPAGSCSYWALPRRSSADKEYGNCHKVSPYMQCDDSMSPRSVACRVSIVADRHHTNKVTEDEGQPSQTQADGNGDAQSREPELHAPITNREGAAKGVLPTIGD